MSRGQGPKLVYCLVDGQPHHVSEFAHIVPKNRPFVSCPECNSQLILKLGTSGKRVHHAAHKPESLCILTKPESVRHLNSKIHIFNQLLQGQAIYINQVCTGWTVPIRGPYGGGQRSCFGDRVRPRLWLEGWDKVEIERQTGSRRPDIVFYKANVVIGALEICATHAVDEEKRADLKTLGIPWLEVKAAESLYEDDEYNQTTAWSITQPLSHIGCDPAIPSWTCNSCLEGPDKFLDRVKAQQEAEERAVAEREAEIQKYLGPENRIIKAKAICLFRDNGLFECHELLIFERASKSSTNEVEAIYIRDGKNGRVIAEEHAPITDQSFKNINQAYRQWRQMFGFSYRIVDITRWIPYQEMREESSQWRSPFIYDERKQMWVEKSKILSS